MSAGGSSPARRTAGLAMTFAGVVVLIGGWLRLGRAEILADQISYLASSGIGGTALILSGLAFAASANARDEVTGRLDRIESAIRRDRGETTP
jgi:hypothetical protein